MKDEISDILDNFADELEKGQPGFLTYKKLRDKYVEEIMEVEHDY